MLDCTFAHDFILVSTGSDFESLVRQIPGSQVVILRACDYPTGVAAEVLLSSIRTAGLSISMDHLIVRDQYLLSMRLTGAHRRRSTWRVSPTHGHGSPSHRAKRSLRPPAGGAGVAGQVGGPPALLAGDVEDFRPVLAELLGLGGGALFQEVQDVGALR